jgi:hypothetical protein
MSKTALILLFGAVSVSAFADPKLKSIRGFQNIPWYSSVAQVAKGLPNSIIVNQCDSAGDKKTEAELRRLAREGNWSCRSVINSNYLISGTKFFLDTTFNNKDQLTNVSLRFLPGKDKDAQDAAAECEEIYKKVNSMLEIKYGDSFFVKNGTAAMGYENFDMRVWVLSPTEIWIRNSWGLKNPDSLLSSKCRFEINYGPRVSEELDKL